MITKHWRRSLHYVNKRLSYLLLVYLEIYDEHLALITEIECLTERSTRQHAWHNLKRNLSQWAVKI